MVNPQSAFNMRENDTESSKVVDKSCLGRLIFFIEKTLENKVNAIIPRNRKARSFDIAY